MTKLYDELKTLAEAEVGDPLLAWFLREHLPAILSALKDSERLDRLEQEAKDGGCPGLVNDDNGHWAVSDSSIQPVPTDSAPQDLATTFFVNREQWKPTIREAIDAAQSQEDRHG